MSTKMQQEVSCNATTKSVTFLATLSSTNLQLKILGNWIKWHREKKNISQETAAELAGLSRFQWIRIETGKSGTKKDTLIQIANVIGADVGQTLRKSGFVDESYETKSSVENQILTFLSKVDFSVFNEQDLEEIADFIRFKEYQKINEEVLSARKQRLVPKGVSEFLIEAQSHENQPNQTKFEVMKNLLMDERLDYNQAIELSKQFFDAYDGFRTGNIDNSLDEIYEVTADDKKQINVIEQDIFDKKEVKNKKA